MIQRIRDWLLERRIRATYKLICERPEIDEAYALAATWAGMINSRSPEQIARMEREKGLT